MAHVQKFAMAAVGHMCNHFERTGNAERSNVNIDSERTGLNYNLAPAREQSQVDFIRQRISEVKCQKRADVKVMCDWVITIPKDFQAAHPDREREFFERSYEFLEQRYGAANVISAYVHKDEITPHMHFAFVPVTTDKRKGIEKVSAKEVLTRADLRTFHNDLQEHLERTLGVEVNVQNEATKDGNKAIAELKRGTAKAELEKLETKRQSLNEKLEHYGERLTALSESYNARKAFLDSPEIKSTVKPQKRFKNGFMGLGGDEMVTLYAADFERLQRQAAEVEKCKDYCKNAEQAYSAWSAKSVKVFDELKAKDKKIEKLEKQVEDGKEQNRKLKADIAELKERDEIAAAVIEQLPAAKALRDEIADRKATEKILAHEPKQELVYRDDNTIYAEMQRQILTEGKTAATIDFSKVAAALYANNGSTNRTAELIKRFTGKDFNAAYKIAVRGRQLCNGRGFGMER